ncbi:MAG: hypothetical protein KF712_04660 [Akkermansiaceae bacterium]|nr:hypothetical protein [Akkermansiaceae bacterium]
MSGILLPHPILRRGSITRSGRVSSRSGIITRHGETDPLEGIPFNLRLQTHRGEVRGVINDILVTGAGDASVNGLYQMDGYFDGKPWFRHASSNISIIWFSGWLPEPVWLLNATNGPAYINLNNPDLPPEEGWQDAGGGGAMPVIRFITHQRLAPVGLYKDTACTTPATAAGDLIAAWRDEISGSGLVAVQDVSTKRPILRFASGVPVLEFDGVDDHLTLTLARPFPFSLSVGAKNNTTGFGGMAGYGPYNIAIGNYYDGLTPDNAFWLWSPDRAAGYGEENSLDLNWHSHIGLIPNGDIDKAAWSMYLDGVRTGSPGTPANAPMLGDSTTLSIGQDGFGAHWSGRMTSYMQANSIWSAGEIARISTHVRHINPDPMAEVPAILRLQTHRGNGIPLGLYQDVACTIPATTEGDSIAAWRDEISGGGLVAVQSVSTKRPTLRFVSGTPVIRFDGADDVLHTTILAPDDAFSYAASGRFRSTGLYPALIGAPPGGVTFGAGGANLVGINQLGVNDPQTAVDVGTDPFAFVVTYEPNIYSYHVRRQFEPDVIITDQTDGSGGYLATGELMIGNGHNGEIAAPVDLTSILILPGSRWTENQMASAASHLHSFDPDPLAGLDFSLRLQTHRGDGVPFGLYKDVACTIPAMEDGDSVAAWRDELSGSGLVLEQSIPAKRPTLQFVSGVPVLEFDGIDDFLIATGVPTISGIISATATGMYRSSAQDNGRLLSMADTSNMDWEGGTGYVPALRPLSDSEVGVQYAESHGYQNTLANEWFTFASRATGSAIETWKNGNDKVTASVNTSAIASTRIKIGGSFAFSDTADLWDGYISSVAFGPWTEAQTLQTQFHFSKLRPS